MKRFFFTFCLGLFIVFHATAQTTAVTSFGEDFLKAWKRHKVYTLRIAEALPADQLGYKPQTEARSFGEILIHITGVNYMFSSISGGQGFPIDKENLT